MNVQRVWTIWLWNHRKILNVRRIWTIERYQTLAEDWTSAGGLDQIHSSSGNIPRHCYPTLHNHHFELCDLGQRLHPFQHPKHGLKLQDLGHRNYYSVWMKKTVRWVRYFMLLKDKEKSFKSNIKPLIRVSMIKSSWRQKCRQQHDQRTMPHSWSSKLSLSLITSYFTRCKWYLVRDKKMVTWFWYDYRRKNGDLTNWYVKILSSSPCETIWEIQISCRFKAIKNESSSSHSSMEFHSTSFLVLMFMTQFQNVKNFTSPHSIVMPSLTAWRICVTGFAFPGRNEATRSPWHFTTLVVDLLEATSKNGCLDVRWIICNRIVLRFKNAKER